MFTRFSKAQALALLILATYSFTTTAKAFAYADPIEPQPGLQDDAKKKAEEEAKKKAEAEKEKQRLADEEKKKAEKEKQRLAEEEKKKADDLAAAKKKAEDEAARKAAELADAKKKEEDRKRADEERSARRREEAKQDAAKKKAEDDAEKEKRRLAEEEKKKADQAREDRRKKTEDDKAAAAAAKKTADDLAAAKKKAEDDAAKKAGEIADAKKKGDQAREDRRKKAEDDKAAAAAAKKTADDLAAAKKKAEDDAAKKAGEIADAKKKGDQAREDRRKKAEDDKAAAAAAKKTADDLAAAKKAGEIADAKKKGDQAREDRRKKAEDDKAAAAAAKKTADDLAAAKKAGEIADAKKKGDQAREDRRKKAEDDKATAAKKAADDLAAAKRKTDEEKKRADRDPSKNPGENAKKLEEARKALEEAKKNADTKALGDAKKALEDSKRASRDDAARAAREKARQIAAEAAKRNQENPRKNNEDPAAKKAAEDARKLAYEQKRNAESLEAKKRLSHVAPSTLVRPTGNWVKPDGRDLRKDIRDGKITVNINKHTTNITQITVVNQTNVVKVIEQSRNVYRQPKQETIRVRPAIVTRPTYERRHEAPRADLDRDRFRQRMSREDVYIVVPDDYGPFAHGEVYRVHYDNSRHSFLIEGYDRDHVYRRAWSRDGDDLGSLKFYAWGHRFKIEGDDDHHRRLICDDDDHRTYREGHITFDRRDYDSDEYYRWSAYRWQMREEKSRMLRGESVYVTMSNPVSPFARGEVYRVSYNGNHTFTSTGFNVNDYRHTSTDYGDPTDNQLSIWGMNFEFTTNQIVTLNGRKVGTFSFSSDGYDRSETRPHPNDFTRTIANGTEFYVYLQSGQSFEGGLGGGETYKVSYQASTRSFLASGYGSDNIEREMAGDEANLERNNQISIWGTVFRFDAYGNLRLEGRDQNSAPVGMITLNPGTLPASHFAEPFSLKTDIMSGRPFAVTLSRAMGNFPAGTVFTGQFTADGNFISYLPSSESGAYRQMTGNNAEINRSQIEIAGYTLTLDDAGNVYNGYSDDGSTQVGSLVIQQPPVLADAGASSGAGSTPSTGTNPGTSSGSGSVPMSTVGGFSILVSGDPIVNFDFPPRKVKGRDGQDHTMVQFRPIFEKIGYFPKYDSAKNQITVPMDNGVVMTIPLDGRKTVTITQNGVVIDEPQMEIAPIVDNGHTMVPLRFIGEHTGWKVEYTPPPHEQVNFVPAP